MLLKDLGKAFRGDGLSFKPYPCGRPLHASIDAALASRARIGSAAITGVTITLDPGAHADQFLSGPATRRPTQVVEAQFALPFLVATALVHGKVGIGEVSGLGDAETLALADRIQGAIGPTGKPRGWAEIRLTLDDGRVLSQETSDPIGSPDKPISPSGMRAKFQDCAANAVRPVPSIDVSWALGMLEELENAADMRTLTRRFV